MELVKRAFVENIIYPSAITALALNPSRSMFYVGGRDNNI